MGKVKYTSKIREEKLDDDMNKELLIEQINQFKKEKNAIILAHVYQDPAIQDIADFIGDSLALSKKAVDADADLIVFCGVKFMAETAHILNPSKTVLLPSYDAGCGLADMATFEKLKQEKRKYPDAAVVSYVNSSAEIKAASDICCTSSNAVDIVNALKQDTILFLPDKNLGSYIAEQSDKQIILWDGYCYVHQNITPQHIKQLKKQHPDAEVIVHPECPKKVRHLSDFIGGTGPMTSYAKQSTSNEFIVGTEDNFVYRLQSVNPDKTFYSVQTQCEGMRKSSLVDVKQSLAKEQYRISIDENIRKKAYKALDNMMKLS